MPHPHHDDPIKSEEHEAFVRLMTYPDEMQVSGRTSALDVPHDAHLVVPAGSTLTIDSDFACYSLRVEGSVEWVENEDIVLRFVDIGLMPGSSWHQRCAAGFEHLLSGKPRGQRDKTRDPLDLGATFMSHTSDLVIQGTPRVPYVRVAEIETGMSEFSALSTPVGWLIGDEVLVPRTTQDGVDEFFSVLDITGGTVILDGLIEHPHRLEDGTFTSLVNLTRNIVFMAESTEIDQRHHYMQMHQNGARIEYVRFDRMGRTDADRFVTDPEVDPNGDLVPGSDDNSRGRYPVHFHMRSGVQRTDAHLNTIHGCVISGSPSHGLVNHGAYVESRNNIAINCKGSAFFGENGLEIGTFNGDIAVNSFGTSHRPARNAQTRGDQFFGVRGNGIWLQSGGITVENCQVYGAREAGIEIVGSQITEAGVLLRVPTETLRDGPRKSASLAAGAMTMNVSELPALIRNNLVTGSPKGYASTLNNWEPRLVRGEEWTLIQGNRFMEVNVGIHVHYSGWLHIKENLFIGATHPYVSRSDVREGITTRNNFRQHGIIEGNEFRNFHYGVNTNARGKVDVGHNKFSDCFVDIAVAQPTITNHRPDQTFSGNVFGDKTQVTQKAQEAVLAGKWGGAPEPVNYLFKHPFHTTRNTFTELALLESPITIDGRVIYFDEHRPEHVLFSGTDNPEVDGLPNRVLNANGSGLYGRWPEDWESLDVYTENTTDIPVYVVRDAVDEEDEDEEPTFAELVQFVRDHERRLKLLEG